MPEGIPNNQEHPIEISKEVFEKCLGLTFAEIQKQHPKIAEALLRDNPEASNAWEFTPEFREIDLMKAAYYKEESSIKESLGTQEKSLENTGKNPSKTELTQKAVEASALRQESAEAGSSVLGAPVKEEALSPGNLAEPEEGKRERLGFEATTEEEFRERAVKMENDLQVLLCLDSLSNEDRIVLEDYLKMIRGINIGALIGGEKNELNKLSDIRGEIERVTTKYSSQDFTSAEEKKKQMDKQFDQRQELWEKLISDMSFERLRKLSPNLPFSLEETIRKQAIFASGGESNVDSEKYWDSLSVSDKSYLLNFWLDAAILTLKNKKADRTVNTSGETTPAPAPVAESEGMEEEVDKEDEARVVPPKTSQKSSAKTTKVGGGAGLAPAASENEEEAAAVEAKEKVALEVVDSMVKENGKVLPAVKKATAWAGIAKESGLLTGQAAGLSLLGTAYGMFWSGFWMMDEILRRAQEGKFL